MGSMIILEDRTGFDTAVLDWIAYACFHIISCSHSGSLGKDFTKQFGAVIA